MIRDLVLGAELAKGSKDRADYLELRQKAQFAGAGRPPRRGGARGAGPARRMTAPPPFVLRQAQDEGWPSLALRAAAPAALQS